MLICFSWLKGHFMIDDASNMFLKIISHYSESSQLFLEIRNQKLERSASHVIVVWTIRFNMKSFVSCSSICVKIYLIGVFFSSFPLLSLHLFSSTSQTMKQRTGFLKTLFHSLQNWFLLIDFPIFYFTITKIFPLMWVS